MDFVSFANDATIVSAGRDGSVRTWSSDSQTLLREFLAHETGSNIRVGFAVSPDGKLLAAGSAGSDANLWSLDRGEILRSYSGHTSLVTAAAFSPDGTLLATGSDDRTIRLWNVLTGHVHRVISTRGEVRAVAWSPTGEWLAASDMSMVVGLYNAETGRQDAQFASRRGEPPRVLVFSPDGGFLATTGASDSIVNVWSIAERRLWQYSEIPDLARAVVFLPNSTESYLVPLCTHFRFVPYRRVDVLRLDPGKLLEVAELHAGMRIEKFGLVPFSGGRGR